MKPGLHETEAETTTSHCETNTDTKKVVSRPRWSPDLNISGFHCHDARQKKSTVSVTESISSKNVVTT